MKSNDSLNFFGSSASKEGSRDPKSVRILPYFQEEMMVQENPIELEKTIV